MEVGEEVATTNSRGRVSEPTNVILVSSPEVIDGEGNDGGGETFDNLTDLIVEVGMGGSGDHEVLQPITKDHNEGGVEFLAQTSKQGVDVVDVKGKGIAIESEEETDQSDDDSDEEVADAEEVAGETEDDEIPGFVIPDDPT